MALMSQLVLKNTGKNLLPAVLCSQSYSSGQLSSYKRGRGGRSSFSGEVVTVFGATGFIGRYLVNQLGKQGCQVIIPYRRDPYTVRDLKLCGDLGQILFLPFELRDEVSIRNAMKYSNIVVNLIGREWETKMYKFHDVHKIGAANLARIAKESGVERFIHFSAMNVADHLETHYIPGGSRFLRSKYHGEVAVKKEYPDATIMRPADVFGQEDRFLQYYARRWRRTILGNIPLYNKGISTTKMPIYVDDVAKAVVLAMRNPDTAGRTYELRGPRAYLMSDLIDYMYKSMRFNPLPKRVYVNSLFQLKTHLFSFAPSRPLLSLDKLDRDAHSDVLTGLPTAEDLGLDDLTRIESRLDYEVKQYRKLNYMEESIGEYPPPAWPPSKLAY